jgi:hypothetical protein
MLSRDFCEVNRPKALLTDSSGMPSNPRVKPCKAWLVT